MGFFKGLLISIPISFILWLLIALVIMGLLDWSSTRQESYNGFDTISEYQEAKRLHKYHGTDFSIKTEDGQEWFYRDGKWCRLWSPGGE